MVSSHGESEKLHASLFDALVNQQTGFGEHNFMWVFGWKTPLLPSLSLTTTDFNLFQSLYVSGEMKHLPSKFPFSNIFSNIKFTSICRAPGTLIYFIKKSILIINPQVMFHIVLFRSNTQWYWWIIADYSQGSHLAVFRGQYIVSGIEPELGMCRCLTPALCLQFPKWPQIGDQFCRNYTLASGGWIITSFPSP